MKKDDISMYSSVCSYCARWNPMKDPNVCEAFPNGIPVKIWQGKDKHMTVHPGDRGKTFRLIEGSVYPEWYEEYIK